MYIQKTKQIMMLQVYCSRKFSWVTFCFVLFTQFWKSNTWPHKSEMGIFMQVIHWGNILDSNIWGNKWSETERRKIVKNLPYFQAYKLVCHNFMDAGKFWVRNLLSTIAVGRVSAFELVFWSLIPIRWCK